MTITYRAAYLLTADRQGEVVLTLPEHSELDDEALLAEARAEMERVGIEQGDSTLEIGDWTE